MVFLILAAQYEKWSLPLGVLTAVPFALFGALLAILLRGLDNDVYFQIGLTMLVALAAKNAILIFEYAVMNREGGQSVYDAAMNAARDRLRPIVMTSLAFILGCVPLAIAVGVAANSKHSIGTGVIGGMLGATVIAVFFIPMFYWLLEITEHEVFGGEKQASPPAPPAARGARQRLRRMHRAEPTDMRPAFLLSPPPRGGVAAPATGWWEPPRRGGAEGDGVVGACRSRYTARPRVGRSALTLAATLGAALSGCMVGPDYHRPKVDVPAAYRYEPTPTAETANIEWWKQFGDPVLDQLIAEALANNDNVKIAVANVELAAGFLTTTRSPLFPQVGYQGDAVRQRLSENSGIPLTGVTNPQNAYQALLNASWEIDLWGRIRRLSESAQANLLASDEARRGVILSLVASVANSYLLLRGLDQQLDIARRTRELYAQALQLMELKFKYGRVSQMNVAQARSQYETAAAQIPPIELQIAQLENALSVLLGRNPGPIPRGKTILELALPEVPAGVPSQLLERRPDLLQAEQQLIAANAQIGAAKALYFPTISLTGAVGGASTELNDLFKGPSRVWSYGGSIIGPIFTGGAISGQVAQATAGQQAALFAYELSIQSAFADVETALVSRQKLAEQVAAQERLVQALREYARLAQLLFDGGRESYTTVLQAQQQLFPEELSLAAQRTQLYASLVGIYRATGGGWVNEAGKLAPQPLAVKR